MRKKPNKIQMDHKYRICLGSFKKALSRYEMIIEKSLYKAYNELLRLQGIRQGVTVLPSLSVDVNLSQENGFVL